MTIWLNRRIYSLRSRRSSLECRAFSRCPVTSTKLRFHKTWMIRCNVMNKPRKRFKRVLRLTIMTSLDRYRYQTLMRNALSWPAQLVDRPNKYESQIKFRPSLSQNPTCCKFLKLKTLKVSTRPRAHLCRSRTYDCLAKLTLHAIHTSCYRLRLLPTSSWRMTRYSRLLASKVTVLRPMTPSKTGNPRARCPSLTRSRGRDFTPPTMTKCCATRNTPIVSAQVSRAWASPTSQRTSPACLTQRNSIRNCGRIDKKCAKTKSLTRYLKFGKRWMQHTNRFMASRPNHLPLTQPSRLQRSYPLQRLTMSLE